MSTAPNAHTAPTSRAREVPVGDEEAASELKLGEFAGVPTLSLSEARLLINALIEHRRQTHRRFVETESVPPPFSPVPISTPVPSPISSPVAASTPTSASFPSGLSSFAATLVPLLAAHHISDDAAEAEAEAEAPQPPRSAWALAMDALSGSSGVNVNSLDRDGKRVEYVSADGKVHENRTLLKMQDYLDVFARFKSKENIEAVERLLAAHAEFESFEKSQLGG